MRKRLAVTLILLLAFPPPTSLWAQGPCSVYRTWSTGDSLTAPDLNSSFTTAVVTNMEFSCLDDLSSNVAEMQTAVDPYAAKTESLATTGAGEIHRLRFILERVFGWSSWYRHTDNIDFTHRASGVDGSGLGRHVTAVGFHAWGGSAAFPTYTSVADHQTGIWFPTAGHLSVSIRDPNVDGGRKGGIELVRFHAAGLVFHHTVALRFAHSEAVMHNGQRGHVTALAIDPATDQLVWGHAGATSRFEAAKNTFTGQSEFKKAYAALYDAGTGSLTWTPNLANGNVQKRTANASGTLSVPTNAVAGATIILILVQDATGSRIVTWGSGWHFPAGTEGVLSTAANAIDVLSGVYDGTNWLVILSKDHKA